MSRSFTALSNAQCRVRCTLRTVVLLRPGFPLRKDGRWEGRYTAGYDSKTGKRIIKNVLGHL